MKKIFFLAAALIAAVVVSGCRKAAPPPPKADPVVYVTPASMRDVDRGTTVIGTVKAEDTVELYARVEGFLLEQGFVDGGEVKAGQMLFKIEPDLYQARVDEAAAKLAGAEASQHRAEMELERQRTLAVQDASSQRELEIAEAAQKNAAADVASAQAELKMAQLDLSYTCIDAPFDGLMGYSAFAEGSLVGPESGPLADIVRLDPIQVDFSVSESDLLDLRKYMQDKKIDLEVTIFLQNNSMYSRKGVIIARDNQVDSETGTILFRAQFENPDGELLPGMYVRVAIRPSGKYQLLMVPTVALNTDIEGDYVFTVDAQGKVARKDVAIGVTDGNWTIIREGLEPGELVVTSGVQKTRAGGTVKAENDPAFAAAETVAETEK